MAEEPQKDTEGRNDKQRKEEPAGEPGSELWRLLTTPEELIEGEIKLPIAPSEPSVSEVPPDVDEAVLQFQREAITTINCKNHPDVPSIAECPECASYYCAQCMVIKKGKLLCKTCAEAAFAPTEEELIEQIARGETGEDERLDFLAVSPPQFNPTGVGEGKEGGISNPFRRILAYILDLAFLRIAYLLAFSFLITLLWLVSGGNVPSLASIGGGNFLVGIKIVGIHLLKFKPLPLLMLLDFLYFFVCYSIVNRTIGMSWMNLRIVSLYGEFVAMNACFLRALVLVLSFGLSIIIAVFHPRRMSLHDILAQTYEINYSGLKSVDAYQTIDIRF